MGNKVRRKRKRPQMLKERKQQMKKRKELEKTIFKAVTEISKTLEEFVETIGELTGFYEEKEAPKRTLLKDGAIDTKENRKLLS